MPSAAHPLECCWNAEGEVQVLPPSLLGFPSLSNYNVVLKEEVRVCVRVCVRMCVRVCVRVCVCVCASLTVVTKTFVVVKCYYGNHD